MRYPDREPTLVETAPHVARLREARNRCLKERAKAREQGMRADDGRLFGPGEEEMQVLNEVTEEKGEVFAFSVAHDVGHASPAGG